MDIAIFSLHDVIREYNEENGAQLSPEESFGLSSLSDDSLRRFEAAIAGVNAVAQNTYAEVVNQINQERDVWYKAQITRFDDEEYWRDLLSGDGLNKNTKKEVESLKKSWEVQKRHVNHTSATLEQLALTVLPNLQDYIRVAKRECSARHSLMPKAIQRRFKAYVAETEHAIEEYNKDLINSMLVRLKAAELSKNWKVDDVVMVIVKRIDQLGLLHLNQKSIFQPREGMSLRVFKFFIEYIQLNGSAQQKKILWEGVWFGSDANFQKVKHGNRCCLVPADMKKITPRFYFSSTLFPHRHFRHEFFHAKLWMLSRLKTMHSHTKVSKHLSINMAERLFEDLCQLESEVSNAQHEAESWRVSNWKRFFYRKTNEFVTAYARFTGSETLKLAQKKLEVIHMLRMRIETDFSEANEKRDYVNQDLINRAIQLCDQFQELNKAVVRGGQLRSRFDNDLRYFQELLQRCETKNESVVEEELSVDIFDSADFEMLYAASSEVVVTAKEIEAKGVFEATAQVNLVSLTDDNFEQIVNKLSNTILDLPPEANDEYLNKAMSTHFIDYLKCCHEIENKEQFVDKKARILRVENLLEQHGPEFIKTRVSALVKTRDLDDNWFGFKTLSSIYLQSCTVQEDNHSALKQGV